MDKSTKRRLDALESKLQPGFIYVIEWISPDEILIYSRPIQPGDQPDSDGFIRIPWQAK